MSPVPDVVQTKMQVRYGCIRAPFWHLPRVKGQPCVPSQDLMARPVQEDDEFLLVACDGIWNSVDSQQAVDFVRQRLAEGKPLKQITQEVRGRRGRASAAGAGRAPSGTPLTLDAPQLLDVCMSHSLRYSDGSGCDNETAIVIVLKDIKGKEVGVTNTHGAGSVVLPTSDVVPCARLLSPGQAAGPSAQGPQQANGGRGVGERLVQRRIRGCGRRPGASGRPARVQRHL